MTVLSILAIALACLSLGMQLGRALTLWEKQPEDSYDQRGQGED